MVLEAVAFATVFRPSHGYPPHRLFVMLGAGAGAGLAALLTAGAAVWFANRRHGTLLGATTSLRTLGVVLAAFVAAAGGSPLVRALGEPASQDGSSAAQRADFQRWQQAVVPLVVRWMDAIRADKAFAHGLPTKSAGDLRRRVDQSERTFSELAAALANEAPRLPHRRELRGLTSRLETALVTARDAQLSYEIALATTARTAPARSSTSRGRLRGLIARGNREAARSMAIMGGFSIEANRLGSALFAQHQ